MIFYVHYSRLYQLPAFYQLWPLWPTNERLFLPTFCCLWLVIMHVLSQDSIDIWDCRCQVLQPSYRDLIPPKGLTRIVVQLFKNAKSTCFSMSLRHVHNNMGYSFQFLSTTSNNATSCFIKLEQFRFNVLQLQHINRQPRNLNASSGFNTNMPLYAFPPAVFWCHKYIVSLAHQTWLAVS